MALFYTGKGDKGQSHIGKKKYSKDSPIMEALGDLDELNSLLGVIRAAAKKGLNKKTLFGARKPFHYPGKSSLDNVQ